VRRSVARGHQVWAEKPEEGVCSAMFKRALMPRNEERIRIKPALVNAWYRPKYESIEP
jgi:hypothetical protein